MTNPEPEREISLQEQIRAVAFERDRVGKIRAATCPHVTLDRHYHVLAAAAATLRKHEQLQQEVCVLRDKIQFGQFEEDDD